MERAGDEIASWFGDDEARRRRDQDNRGKGPKGYTRSDDRIRDDINDRLSDDWQIDASNIEVKVDKGEVTLTGEVSARQAKRRAEDVAEEIPGVRHVQNNLRVSGQSSGMSGSGMGSGSDSTPSASGGTTGTSSHGSASGAATGTTAEHTSAKTSGARSSAGI